MLLESNGVPISKPSRNELESRLAEGEYNVIGRIQAKIERRAALKIKACALASGCN